MIIIFYLLLSFIIIIILNYHSHKFCQLIHAILVLWFGYIFIILISFWYQETNRFLLTILTYFFWTRVWYVCMCACLKYVCTNECTYMHTYGELSFWTQNLPGWLVWTPGCSRNPSSASCTWWLPKIFRVQQHLGLGIWTWVLTLDSKHVAYEIRSPASCDSF